MSTDDPLAHAISEWQRKHRIADDDPILAVLRLVRLQLQHAHTDRDSAMQRRRVSKTSGARLRCSTDADAAPATLILRHTYNLTSDRTIPYSTFAKAVVDTTSSLGQSGDKGFFKNQAQIHIAAALETLREIGADVTLENAYSLLLDQGDLDEAKSDLASSHQTTCRRELTEHFANRFLSQPPEQIGGVRLTHREWIDLVVGVLIGAYIVKEAVEILHDARTASREQV